MDLSGLQCILDLNELEMKVNASQKGQHSIYKVPAYLSDLNKKAYVPQIVSFGPYHHGDPQCNPMHKHKLRALFQFVKRSKKPIESYKGELEKVVTQLKNSYDALDGTSWPSDKDEFLPLMILDGVFMLELLKTAADRLNDYPPDDPIFGDHGKLYYHPFIRRDMLLIENQIPMQVLEKLMAVENPKPQIEESLEKLIFKFFDVCDTNVTTTETKDILKESLHLLDLYRKTMLVGGSPTTTAPVTKAEKPTPPQREPSTSASSSSDVEGNRSVPNLEIMRSATELDEAGVDFKRLPTGHNINDISFDNIGVLSLPTLVVDDHTESIFLNLMAFERLHVGTKNQITSYICFMDSIIDSASDVAILRKQGIIQNAIGSNKAVASLFNQIAKEVPLDAESSLRDVEKAVNDYCKRKWPQWRAHLWHYYLNSPWAWISLLAGIFLLLLTVVQTTYGIWDFYKK